MSTSFPIQKLRYLGRDPITSPERSNWSSSSSNHNTRVLGTPKSGVHHFRADNVHEFNRRENNVPFVKKLRRVRRMK